MSLKIPKISIFHTLKSMEYINIPLILYFYTLKGSLVMINKVFHTFN